MLTTCVPVFGAGEPNKAVAEPFSVKARVCPLIFTDPIVPCPVFPPVILLMEPLSVPITTEIDDPTAVPVGARSPLTDIGVKFEVPPKPPSGRRGAS